LTLIAAIERAICIVTMEPPRKSQILRAAALTAALLACATAAAAQSSEPSLESKWRKACWGDAFNHCTFSAMAGDRKAVRNCLVRNIDHISPACRAVINDANSQGIRDPNASSQAAASSSASAQP
jgi:hypothetical protein